MTFVFSLSGNCHLFLFEVYMKSQQILNTLILWLTKMFYASSPIGFNGNELWIRNGNGIQWKWIGNELWINWIKMAESSSPLLITAFIGRLWRLNFIGGIAGYFGTQICWIMQQWRNKIFNKIMKGAEWKLNILTFIPKLIYHYPDFMWI